MTSAQYCATLHVPLYSFGHEAILSPTRTGSQTTSILGQMDTSAVQSAKHADRYRLPTNVKPVHYDLTIRTDLKNLKFDGYVIIR